MSPVMRSPRWNLGNAIACLGRNAIAVTFGECDRGGIWGCDRGDVWGGRWRWHLGSAIAVGCGGAIAYLVGNAIAYLERRWR
ncbi:MAG: hypothetical protein AB4290_18305 [Spirulina sp.]